MIQSLGSDGTGDVVPRPISPGKTFTYVFIVHQLGKSPYDSYYIMQTVAGLHGLIDVLPPYGMAKPFAQDYDKSIILDDRYYESYYDWMGEPESLLIPGKGKFDYAESTTPSSHLTARDATHPTAHDAINPEYPHWTSIFELQDHNLTVVEADGHYIVPSLIVYSGKTYSVKIKADQDPSRNYSITTNIVGQNASATTPLGLAVLSYSPPAGPIQNDVTP
ncbi:hypothetical protein EUGRSUZ_I00361 [Eucalyptus grandis]|uniref:Uncharacterized protein n=2 Tax=Eucalyptus grandis TaxID=71139 RepID=A0ACC3JC18_EUCGR|nr:hypothetical protein EUGRSUZ_I00361 [Eucalyptus grandis]